ncbi:hypothetical protein Hdeb2414_s0006g00218811 [Helianthus debilis subsp. tardiflorus]
MLNPYFPFGITDQNNTHTTEPLHLLHLKTLVNLTPPTPTLFPRFRVRRPLRSSCSLTNPSLPLVFKVRRTHTRPAVDDR